MFFFFQGAIYLEFIIKSQKLPAMVLAWENLQEVFVMLVVISFLYLHFVVVVHLPMFFIDIIFFDIILHHTMDYQQVFTPILYFQPSPLHSDLWHFHFQPFRYLLTASTTVWSGHFLPAGIFYRTLPPDIFGTSCFYQGFPGSWQLFLEIWRASY